VQAAAAAEAEAAATALREASLLAKAEEERAAALELAAAEKAAEQVILPYFPTLVSYLRANLGPHFYAHPLAHLASHRGLPP
jgi:hypothetical protein